MRTDMTIPSAHFSSDDLESLDHRAYVANKRGDRCGWHLLCALTSHLRDALYDATPWLRDDPVGEHARRPGPLPSRYHLRSGRVVYVPARPDAPEWSIIDAVDLT